MADAPASPVSEPAAQEQLLRGISVIQQELTEALVSGDFYAELALAGGAIALAFIAGWIIRRFWQKRLQAYFPKLTADALAKPLQLLGPVLAILALATVRPIAETYTGNALVVQGLIKLTIALIIIRTIFMLVHSRLMAWVISLAIGVLAALAITGLMQPVAAYLDSMAFSMGKVHLSALGVLHGLVILAIALWASTSLSHATEKHIHRMGSLSYNARELIIKIVKLVIYIIAFLITLTAMGIDLTVLAVFGGALGVGIGLGLQKVTSNFVSGMTLLMEKSIQIGDIIEIGTNTGTVRQLNTRYALIETADGRDLMIPNEQLMSSEVSNWTHSNARGRVEFKVPMAYGCDERLAMQIMHDAVLAHPRALRNPAPLIVLNEFGLYGMTFTVMFWINDIKEGRLGPQSDVMLEILRRFNESGIEMPHPPEAAGPRP